MLAFAAVVLYSRHVWEAAHPAEVMASSGMYAAGDMMLYIFITILGMIPTLFLVRVISKFEASATVYSKILFVTGLSAPLCLGIFLTGRQYVPPNLSVSCFMRLAWSPFFLALMVFSQIVAKFRNAKRLTFYALTSEGVTFCISIALIILSMRSGRH